MLDYSSMHKNDFKCIVLSFLMQNGADYDYLVRQNSELLSALEDLEKTVSTLREENSLLVREWMFSLDLS